ncbi:MAG: hypothetical protein IPN02_10220 [Candidatus Microthrix sp.]|uniref:Uncharacterized protein n=1 Tax=Candidatus Neomicrothrix subdominans TaxID=2954438 RepID=A0A936NDT8_9ACTN|nr:hypothetical protein [Candidatus Microthrix subdominans]
MGRASSCVHNLATCNDAVYVALAESLAATLLTFDFPGLAGAPGHRADIVVP